MEALAAAEDEGLRFEAFAQLAALGGLGGDDGAHFGMVSPDNPGYPKMAYVYDSYEDAWSSAGSTPEGFVTTTAIPRCRRRTG